MSSAANIKGPDDVIYPNFSDAGVPGGIPDVPVVAKLEDYGGRVGSNIADALEKGVSAVMAKGGGALLIGPGTFYLDRPTLITGSNVVLRGTGRDQTRIIFRWEPKPRTVNFIGVKDGDTIIPNRPLLIAAWNASANNKVAKSIKRLSLQINGQEVAQQSGGEGPWFTLTQDNRKTAPLLKDGKNRLRAEVEYVDGTRAEKILSVTVDSENRTLVAAAPTETAIQFAEPTAGAVAWAEGKVTIMPKRGDSELVFSKAQTFAAGDVLKIVWPGGGWGGQPLVEVRGVEGNKVLLKRPLRHNFTEISNVRRPHWIRNSGIENLTLEHSGQHWTNLLGFSGDYGCWVRGVRLLNAGRFPINGGTKYFEVRDSEVEGVRFHFGVGGGTGYFGFSGGQDCLMENVQIKKLRHAPNLQFGAQGCVIRNSVFEDSDAQFHRDANWDNLIENCTIRSRGSNKFFGSYGSALYVTTAQNESLGSGNVIWNNDFRSDTIYDGGSAVTFSGGTARNWIIAYNRFIHDVGYAIKAEKGDHEVLFLKNFFAVEKPSASILNGETGKITLHENRFAGWPQNTPLPTNTKLQGNSDNSYSAHFAEAPRPQTPVPSLYAWQKQQNAKAAK
jgi:hypothetical protein